MATGGQGGVSSEFDALPSTEEVMANLTKEDAEAVTQSIIDDTVRAMRRNAETGNLSVENAPGTGYNGDVGRASENTGEIIDYTSEFIEFSDKAEAQRWGLHEYSTWANELSNEEASAINEYTGDNCFQNINAVLRDAESQYNGSNAQIVQQLNQALRKASVPKNIILFRGASKIMLGKYADFPPEQLIGKVISDKAFMSTSLVNEGAFNSDLTLIIEAPEGAQGAYIGNLSYYPDETEVLLNREQQIVIKEVLDAGTSNMKIVVELIQ